MARAEKNTTTYPFRYVHWSHTKMFVSPNADAFLSGYSEQDSVGFPKQKSWIRGEPDFKPGSHTPSIEKIKAAKESYATTSASQLLHST